MTHPAFNPFRAALERAEDMIRQRDNRIEELERLLAEADALIAKYQYSVQPIDPEGAKDKALARHKARNRT